MSRRTQIWIAYLLFVIVIFAFLLSVTSFMFAIWHGDSRWGMTGGVMIGVAIVLFGAGAAFMADE